MDAAEINEAAQEYETVREKYRAADEAFKTADAAFREATGTVGLWTKMAEARTLRRDAEVALETQSQLFAAVVATEIRERKLDLGAVLTTDVRATEHADDGLQPIGKCSRGLHDVYSAFGTCGRCRGTP